MEISGRLRWADILVPIHECRQSAKLKHNLLGLLLVAVTTVLVEAETSFRRSS